MDMYLTGRLDADTITNISINDAGAEYDALTGLKSRTHFGRPNWTDIFDRLKNRVQDPSYLPGTEASLRTKVGVFYC